MCGTIKTMCVELGTNLHDLGIQSGRFQFSPVPRRYLCQLRCPKSRRIRTRSRVFETNGFFSFEKLSLSQTYNLRQFRGCLFDSDSVLFAQQNERAWTERETEILYERLKSIFGFVSFSFFFIF